VLVFVETNPRQKVSMSRTNAKITPGFCNFDPKNGKTLNVLAGQGSTRSILQKQSPLRRPLIRYSFVERNRHFRFKMTGFSNENDRFFDQKVWNLRLLFTVSMGKLWYLGQVVLALGLVGRPKIFYESQGKSIT
jgi:hypothetical protein